MDLVTGGSGIVGARIIFDLLAHGRKVRAIYRNPEHIHGLDKLFNHWQPGTGEWAQRIQWMEADILDTEALSLAMDGIEHAYHAAAVVSFHKRDYDTMHKINAEGTANVVNACLEADVKQLCFISSVAAIGRSKPGEVIDEEVMWKNSPLNSQYAISKYSGEREIWRGKEEGLNVCVVNPCIIVGPANTPRSSMQVFDRVWHGLRFYTSGSNGFVGVEDVSAACITLMEERVFGERFILCSDNLSYREFFTKIAVALDREPPGKLISASMLKWAWRAESFAEWLRLRKAILTRESVRSAVNNVSYRGGKIEEKTAFRYRSLDEAIRQTAHYYKTELVS